MWGNDSVSFWLLVWVLGNWFVDSDVFVYNTFVFQLFNKLASESISLRRTNVLIFFGNIWKINFIFEFSIVLEEHEPIPNFQEDISIVKERCHVNFVFVVSNQISLNWIRQRVYPLFEFLLKSIFVNNYEFVVSHGFIWTLNVLPLFIRFWWISFEIFHIEDSTCKWDIIVEIEDFRILNQISLMHYHFTKNTCLIFKLVPVFVLDWKLIIVCQSNRLLLSNQLVNLLLVVHHIEVSLAIWKSKTCIRLQFVNGGVNHIICWIDFFDYTLTVEHCNEVNVTLFILYQWNWGNLWVNTFFFISIISRICIWSIIIFFRIVFRTVLTSRLFCCFNSTSSSFSSFCRYFILLFRDHQSFLYKVIWILDNHLNIKLGVIFVFHGVVNYHFHACIKIFSRAIIFDGVNLIEDLSRFKQNDLCVTVVWVHQQEVNVVHRIINIRVIQCYESKSGTSFHS